MVESTYQYHENALRTASIALLNVFFASQAAQFVVTPVLQQSMGGIHSLLNYKKAIK
jgi:hypothetical protein